MQDLFYRQPRLCILAVGFVLVAGLTALQSLPRQEDPALSRRFGEIVTFYPGATAARVESLITEPIEEKLLELHEIADVQSFSRTGSSVIVIELEEEYDESRVDEVWSRVRDKLADVAPLLPEGAAEPEFADKTTVAATIGVAFTWEQPGEVQLALMTRLATELQSRLRVLAGTRETDLFGEADEELRVTIDALRLAEVGLDAGSVANAIASADTRRPSGELIEASSTMPLEVHGELASVDRVRRIPLRIGDDARVLRVGEIAEVEKTIADPPKQVAIFDGVRGVGVSATMNPGSMRVDHWTAWAHEVIDEFGKEVPAGIGYRVFFEQNQYTSERLATLVGNLLLGAFLVVLVLLVMMGIRSAIIVASALPLTLCMVLAELNFFGIPLHQTSVTGLIIALGLLIDNAIVVVDEYELRTRRGMGTAQAIRSVVHDLFVPLFASTLTTVCAFMPIMLMGGPGGEFVGPIAIGVVLSVISSFALSMTLLLAFAGRFLPAEHSHESGDDTGEAGGRIERSFLGHGYSNPALTARYRATITACLERPWMGIAVSIVLPIIGFGVGQTLEQQFFPQVDRDQFQIQIEMPPQSSITATWAAAERARAVVEANEDVVGMNLFIGEASPRVFYNMLGNQSVQNYAGAFVTTTSPDATERVLGVLQRELSTALPEAIVLVLPFEQGPPIDAPIEVRVFGPELDELRRIGDELRGILARTRSVTFTRARVEGGRPKILVTPDEDAVELAGLRLGEVADQLNAALGGAAGGRVLEASEELPIRVRVGNADRGSLARVAATRLLTTRGPSLASSQQEATPGTSMADLAGVPVAAIANFSLEPELAAIMRKRGERVNPIHGFLEPFELPQTALDDFQARLAEANFEVPPGYRIEFGGEAAERSKTLGRLASFALPLFVIMAGAVILTFNSFRFAGIIFAVAALSVGLAMLGVWIFGYPMGFVAIIGTMGLVGLAINDAIVVLNALSLDPRAAQGETEGTTDVVIDATRHVIATTLTTIAGFSPLIVFGGRFWPPMATAIAGGVIGASILALYFVPALFVSTRRRARRRELGPTNEPAAPPIEVVELDARGAARSAEPA